MSTPKTRPMAKHTKMRRALGILISQKKKLTMTISVFCRTKMISSTARRTMTKILVFMVSEIISIRKLVIMMGISFDFSENQCGL